MCPHSQPLPVAKMFNKIQSKIQLPVIGMTLLLLALTLYVSTVTFKKFVQETVDKEINVVARDINSEVDQLRWLALEQIKAISYRHDIIEAVKAKDSAEIYKIIDKYDTARKCEFFTILDVDGNVLARTSERDRTGDSQAHLPCVKIALEQKKAGVYFESTKRIPLSIRATSPILDPDGNLVGISCGGFRLDTEVWVKHIKDSFGVDSTTFVGKMRHITTLVHQSGEKKGQLAIGTELNDPVIIERIFDEKKDFHGESTVVGVQMKVYYRPVVAYNNEVLGILFVGMPIEVQNGLVWGNLRTNLFIAIVGIIVFCVLLYWIVRRIVGPIHAMTNAAKELADGNFETNLDIRTGDEIEVLANAFHRVASSLKEKSEVALAISKGDLTTWVPLSSEHDALGTAFIEMRYALYDSIKDLSQLAQTVAVEGDNLTQTNERLVANTTESAAQLKEVADSIDSLNTQTKENATDARSAENLSTQAKDGAAKGREMMRRMVESMNGITKSSEEIKNIIKVIDDIAFQTNLLALNAAVEAARAGTHGKGFAVVAEEVRNLASRSAKAARETADLIEESIRQVDLGSKVADETAESLNAITDLVEQVNGITTKISGASDRQVEHLDKANRVISQVSETASQNTEAVTDSAQAVTQLSSTAQQLDVITKHFKSNEGGKVSPSKGTSPGYKPPKSANR